MPQDTTQVVILLVCHNGREHLKPCLDSVLSSVDSGVERYIVVVDNGSNDESSDFVRTHFPQVDLLVCNENHGFAEGNNIGWKHAQRAYPSARYLCLLNQDVVVTSGWLGPLVDTLDGPDHIAIVQPKILLPPPSGRINTVGNRSHYLGFTFMTGYGEMDVGQYDKPRSIDCASGAAMMIQCDDLNRTGLFDKEFFMYLEDAELCWKLRQGGRDIRLVPNSIVYHNYCPDAPTRHYFTLERNRWLLLLTYYKCPTLACLLPALVIMEIGQLLFSVMHGLLREKMRVYGYFLNPRKLASVWHRRRDAQRRRLVSDRQFLSRYSGTIEFEAVDSWLLRRVGNPVLNAYWSVVRRLIFW